MESLRFAIATGRDAMVAMFILWHFLFGVSRPRAKSSNSLAKQVPNLFVEESSQFSQEYALVQVREPVVGRGALCEPARNPLVPERRLPRLRYRN